MTAKTVNGIKSWAIDDKPREKLMEKGRSALSDAELLAILINTGMANLTAVDIARDVLKANEGNLNMLAGKTYKELSKIKGIGPAKAITILAALELGGRRQAAETADKEKIGSSADIYNYMYHKLSDLHHEEIWMICLNRAHKILEESKVSEGGGSQAVLDNKKLFKKALEANAHAIILVHNHPSGEIKPSEADFSLTKNVKEAGKVLHINLLDHIIIGDNQYYSFADNGNL